MAMGKIYAREIHAKHITLDDVPKKYRQATIKGYHDIYGIWLEEYKGN